MSAAVEIRAVIDTNVLVSAVLVARGLPARVLAAWRAGTFTLLLSTPMLAELADVLMRPRILRRISRGRAEAEVFLAELVTNVALVRPLPLAALPVHCRDEKDDILLASALGGAATHLVTGDEDLLVLAGAARLGALRIIRPREFSEFLGLPA